MTSSEEALAQALSPLNALRENAQRPVLAFTPVRDVDVPQPYQQLLVHEHDMTNTLRTFHGDDIHLEVQQSMHTGSDYVREVTLNLDRCGTPVEYGAIRLFLERFSEALRSDILANTLPLGALIHAAHLNVTHRPGPYFSVVPDAAICLMLRLDAAVPLYGRCNMIHDSQHDPIAQVVEILPPVRST